MYHYLATRRRAVTLAPPVERSAPFESARVRRLVSSRRVFPDERREGGVRGAGRGFPRELGSFGDGDGDVRFQREGREVHLGHDEVGRFLREDDVVTWFEAREEKAEPSDANANAGDGSRGSRARAPGGFCRLGLPVGRGIAGGVRATHRLW